MTPTKAQIKAAKITDQDREYADDLLGDIDDLGYEDKIEVIAQWFRKVRHEYALTGAAEVSRVVWTDDDAERFIDETIERSAQVADDWFTLASKYRTKENLLARIRALKGH